MNKRWWIGIIAVGLVGAVGIGGWYTQHLGHQRSAVVKTVRVDSTNAKLKQNAGHQAKVIVKKVQPVRKPGQLTQQQAIKQIDNLINSHHITGTLLITNNGPQGVQIRTYGNADVAGQIRNTKTEAYPLASLQKAVTGSIIQQLVNQGKLSLNTPLSKYFPKVAYADQITIRQLLDHKSGIRMAETTPKSVLPTETAQLNFTFEHLQSTNNHAYAYSNANFTLLAGVIRKVTKKSYMDALNRYVTVPLGLKNTYAFNAIPNDVVDPHSYTFDSGSIQNVAISKALQSAEFGCGSLYMSVGDYYKFMYGLQSGNLVGEAGIRQLSNNYQQAYAAGIYYQAGNFIRVGGNDNGFHTFYFGSQDAKLGVCLFENQGNFHNDNLVGYSIRKILEKTEPFS